MKVYKVFETFSGIGAQNKALNNLKEKNLLDYEIIGTSDWDVYSSLSYGAIHNHNNHHESKIKIDIKDGDTSWRDEFDFSLDGETVVNKKNQNENKLFKWYSSFKESNNIGSIIDSYERVENIILNTNSRIDVLTYSFPCQDLSSAGNFHGFNGGIKEGKRSGLLLEIEKLLTKMSKKSLNEGVINNKMPNQRSILPKFLLLENVINLVQKNHRDSFDTWLNKLEKLGYKTIWGIINSNDFGQLQARKRVFALSIFDENNELNWKIRSDLSEQLLEIYNSKEFKPKWIQKHSEVFDFNNKHFEESYLCQMKDTPSRRKMRDLGQKITPEYKGKISTVTKKQDRWPNVGNLIGVERKEDSSGQAAKYLKERFITPREAYKLMGFNDIDYENAQKAMRKHCVSNISAREKLYRQAGNSIAVNSLEMIFYYMNKLEKEANNGEG